jgi:hypothetical protein
VQSTKLSRFLQKCHVPAVQQVETTCDHHFFFHDFNQSLRLIPPLPSESRITTISFVAKIAKLPDLSAIEIISISQKEPLTLFCSGLMGIPANPTRKAC